MPTKQKKKPVAKKQTQKKEKKKMPTKAKVVKQNQFRTEYKDRVSTIRSLTQGVTAGTVADGPENSTVILPKAFIDAFSQGTQNGQIDGNSINLKYLNMKIQLIFDDLKQNYIGALSPNGGAITISQNYYITIRQVWIKKNLSNYLTQSVNNTYSNRAQPAFSSVAIAAQAWQDEANLHTYNSQMEPEFLSYTKKRDTGVIVLKKIKVRPSQDEIPVIDETANTALSVAPKKQYSFNWNMPKSKQLLSPCHDDTNKFVLSNMWIPALVVSVDRTYNTIYEAGKPTAYPPGKLKMSVISHLTYTDN
jgi:hypothetical protein